MTLPLFNRNRGNIAIESATRAKLRAEFQARLNAAHTEIERIVLALPAQLERLHQVDVVLLSLAPAADAARRAFQADAIDMLTYTNLEAAVLARQQEASALRQSIAEQEIALQTLLGGAVPFASELLPQATLP